MTEKLPYHLVPLFEAIYAAGNLSAAARSLGVSQPAVSQMLARLREIVGDPLFESTGRGVMPTPRAHEMAEHLKVATASVEAAFAPKGIDVRTLDRTFTLDIGAGFDALVMPPLVQALVSAAPHVRLVVSNTRGSELLRELRYGETEIAFDFRSIEHDGIRSQQIGSGTAVAIARRNHPALKSGLTKEAYLRLQHVGLAWARSPALSGVAAEQARKNISAQVSVYVPTLMTLGAVVERTDLIATASTVIAEMLGERYKLEIHALPVRFAALELHQFWHARFDNDAAHRWLRTTIKTVCESEIARLKARHGLKK